jgi:hypothetical protein
MSTSSTENKRGFNESLEKDDLLGCMDYGVLQREYLTVIITWKSPFFHNGGESLVSSMILFHDKTEVL